MKKLTNKKGFTLMEMLIVVAIIAILIAIAIPTFTGSLNKAKLAADEANVRAAYSEAMSKYLLQDYTDDDTKTVVQETTNAMQTSATADDKITIGDKTNVTWSEGKKVTVTVKPGTDDVADVKIEPSA